MAVLSSAVCPTRRIYRKRRRSFATSAKLFFLAVSLSNSLTTADSSQRSLPRSWDDDDKEEEGLAYLSDSEREERILSALAGITLSSDGTWSDDEDVNDESDVYEEHDESLYTAATAATDGESSFERNLRKQLDERAWAEEEKRRKTSAESYTSYIPPLYKSQQRLNQNTRRVTKQQQARPKGSPKKKEIQYVTLPDAYRVNDGSTNTAAAPLAEKATEETAAQKQPDTPPPPIPPQPTTVPPISIAPTATNAASTTTPWVRRFLASCHRDVLLPVPKDYCLDNFNLAQLAPVVERIGIQAMTASDSMPSSTTKSFPIYRQALRLIVQEEPLPEDIPDFLQRAARALYFLMHQRYVLSPRGLDMVRRRFLLKESSVDPIFGRCPRLTCAGMPLLPYADSDNLEPADNESSLLLLTSRAKRYCACCGEVFYHWDSKVDGCAWGTSFCHLFLMVFGKDVFGEWKSQRQPPVHVARIFGFRLHPSVNVLQ